MNCVIIFDVSNNQTSQTRERMRAMGYYTAWVANSASPNKRTINLPHNTVWRPNIEPSQALSDINVIVSQLNQNLPGTTLLRCIVLNSTPWFAIDGISI